MLTDERRLGKMQNLSIFLKPLRLKFAVRFEIEYIKTAITRTMGSY